MAAGQWVSRVNIGIASDTKSRSISFARDHSRSLFTNLAHPDAVMARSEFVGAVNFGVAGETEKSRVRSAIDGGRVSLAETAGSAAETINNSGTVNSHGRVLIEKHALSPAKKA